MVNKPAFCLAALLCFAVTASFAQSGDSTVNKVTSFPMRLFGHIQSKTASLNQQLSQQTQKYLQKLQQQEQRLQKKLYSIDSNAAKKLFAGSNQQYATLLQKLQTDTGSNHQKVTGTYQPHMDSLQTALAFLQKNQSALNQPALSPSTLSQPPGSVTTLTGGSAATLTTKVGANLPPEVQAKLQASISQLQALQAKMQDAAQIKGFMAQRKQQIGQYITQHASLQNVLGKPYAQMQQNMYYYSAQIKQYQAMVASPDAIEQKALAMLSRLPAFQGYMKTNSQLSSLFSLPGSSSGPQIIAGLQTRNQISESVKSQLTAAASGTTNNNSSASAAAPSVPSGLESAQSQLASYKAKLSQLGGGGSTIDAPNFRPNEQKTKTFLSRLMYGIDFQTTQSTYYFPTMTSIGLSLGYKLGKGNDVGIGAAMKIGWGTGFNHIAVTGQGVGLRSFVDIALKGSFSATGGFEYNYTAPFTEYQQLRQIQYWTKSALIGISKTISTKSALLKQTKISLLFDALSYQNVPQTEPLIFRVGYNF